MPPEQLSNRKFFASKRADSTLQANTRRRCRHSVLATFLRNYNYPRKYELNRESSYFRRQTFTLSLSLLLAGTTNTSETGERCGRVVVCLSVCLCVRQNKQTSSLITSHICISLEVLKRRFLYLTVGSDVQTNVVLTTRKDRIRRNVQFNFLNLKLWK